jgi:hypothetical protein
MAEDSSPPAGGEKKGGSLGWVGKLLVAVVLLAIVVAIGTHLPSSRCDARDDDEAATAAVLRAYATAQAAYLKTDWAGDGRRQYAARLGDLAEKIASGKMPALLDRNVAQACGPGGAARCNYLFREPKTIGGQPIDWSREFALCAAPKTQGQVKYQTMIVGPSGVVYGKVFESGGSFPDDLPADPAAAGWAEVR